MVVLQLLAHGHRSLRSADGLVPIRDVFGLRRHATAFDHGDIVRHSEILEMFDVFEVLDGAMASFHNRMVQQFVATLREQHGRTISMVGRSDAHPLKHVAKCIRWCAARRPPSS